MTTTTFTTVWERLEVSIELKRRRLLTAGRIGIAVWTVTLAALPVFMVGLRGSDMLDLQVYRNGGLAWLHGFPLYVGFPGLPFTYPPLAAVLFSLFASTPYWLNQTASGGVSAGASTWANIRPGEVQKA